MEGNQSNKTAHGSFVPASKPHEKFIPNPKLKLLAQCSEVFRFYHYSLRTEESYIAWIRRFILFHNKRHPREMGPPEITAFLSDLATVGEVAPATQSQALNAIVFLYRDVLLRFSKLIGRSRAPAATGSGGMNISTPSLLRQKFIQFLTLRDLAERTVHSYTAFIIDLSRFYSKLPDRISPNEVHASFPSDEGQSF